MATKKCSKNVPDYYCEFCNYICSKKSIFNKHLSTNKHKNATFSNEKVSTHKCDLCNKGYTDRTGLWRHKKNCRGNSTDLFHLQSNEEYNSSNIIAPDILKKLLTQNQEFKQLIIEQQQENQKQQQENQKLQNKLISAVKDSGNIINSHNTTNNNQKFNLNFFLNTTCKDAMNMSDFIENIEIGFKDIENIGKNGYVSGMTDMILSRIKELDVTKRPLHCTDLKRETMYIKDNDEWCKDTPDNSKLHKTIKYVAKRNYATIPLWRENYPECQDWNNPKYDFCVDMMRNILGDVGDEQTRLDNKVIKNLSRHILVDKTLE